MSREIAEWLAEPGGVELGVGRSRKVNPVVGRRILDAWIAREYRLVERGSGRRAAIDVYRAPEKRSYQLDGLVLRRVKEVAQIPSETEAVYVVQPAAMQMVKIGSARDVNKRVADLQAGCPVRLRVVAQLVCIKTMEFMIHAAFQEERRHNEWFELSPRLIDFIGHMRTGNRRAIYQELMAVLAADAEKRNGG